MSKYEKKRGQPDEGRDSVELRTGILTRKELQAVRKETYFAESITGPRYCRKENLSSNFELQEMYTR